MRVLPLVLAFSVGLSLPALGQGHLEKARERFREKYEEIKRNDKLKEQEERSKGGGQHPPGRGKRPHGHPPRGRHGGPPAGRPSGGTVGEAWRRARERECPVVIFVHRPGAAEHPKSYDDPAVKEEFEGRFEFAELEFDAENPFIQEARVREAPKLIGTDHYGNVLMRAQADLQRDRLIGFLRTLRQEAQKLAASIESRWRRIQRLMDDKDRTALIRELVKLSGAAKGYPQVLKASEMIPELGWEDLVKVQAQEKTDLKSARKSLEGLVRRYRATIVAIWAQMQLADVLHRLGEIYRAFDTLGRIERSNHPDLDTVQEELEAMRRGFVDNGRKRIFEALERGLDSGLDTVRGELGGMKKEYAGTEVAGTLSSVLDALDR